LKRFPEKFIFLLEKEGFAGNVLSLAEIKLAGLGIRIYSEKEVAIESFF